MPTRRKPELKPKPMAKATWEGPPRYFPDEDRIVGPGDTVTVTQEQLDDPRTPCGPVKPSGKKTGSGTAAKQED